MRNAIQFEMKSQKNFQKPFLFPLKNHQGAIKPIIPINLNVSKQDSLEHLKSKLIFKSILTKDNLILMNSQASRKCRVLDLIMPMSYTLKFDPVDIGKNKI